MSTPALASSNYTRCSLEELNAGRVSKQAPAIINNQTLLTTCRDIAKASVEHSGGRAARSLSIGASSRRAMPLSSAATSTRIATWTKPPGSCACWPVLTAATPPGSMRSCSNNIYPCSLNVALYWGFVVAVLPHDSSCQWDLKAVRANRSRLHTVLTGIPRTSAISEPSSSSSS